MYLVFKQHQRQGQEAREALEFSKSMTAKERSFWNKQARTAKAKLKSLLKEFPQFRENVMYEETI